MVMRAVAGLARGRRDRAAPTCCAGWRRSSRECFRVGPRPRKALESASNYIWVIGEDRGVADGGLQSRRPEATGSAK